MRKIVIILIIALLPSKIFSQLYPFDSIPGTLKKGADAVVRTSQCLFTVKAPGKATMRIREAVTLLNENTSDLRYLAVDYNDKSKINYLWGRVYDARGSLIKTIGSQDVLDISAITGAAFYTDERMKIMRFPLNKYPYTIEYEYEKEYTSLFSYPKWDFQENDNVSVEKSGIQFVLPAGMKLKYYEENLKNKVDSVITGDVKIYTWQETMLPAVSIISGFAGYVSDKPFVDLAPYEFEYDGLKGSTESWKSLGMYFYDVNKDRDKLPESEVNAVRAIAQKYTGMHDKVKAVYEYMQSKTRYVSIQIGIGGFQTAEAESVVRNGYGDCKALSNYTGALLKAAGIKSYMAFVNAGSGIEDIKTEFICDQFNHAILCVPAEKDTIWLECTNQSLPFNYLGSFTCDRHVLLLTPEGGKIVKTPEYRKDQNLTSRTGSLFFSRTGMSSARLKTTYTGYWFGDASSTYSLQSESEMKNFLYESIGYPDFTVSSATYSEEKDGTPRAEFQYQVSINSFGATSGKNIYFAPSLTKGKFLTSDSAKVRIAVSDITVDSITYWIPTGYKVVSLPENVEVSSEFGSYTYSLRTEGERIILYRRLEINKGEITEEKYGEFRNFYNKIAKADRSMVAITET